jgi:hypothetical protein
VTTFQTLVRDFLVQVKEFNCDQWTESSFSLQLEQQQKDAAKREAEQARMQAVPGLMPVMLRDEVEMA